VRWDRFLRGLRLKKDVQDGRLRCSTAQLQVPSSAMKMRLAHNLRPLERKRAHSSLSSSCVELPRCFSCHIMM
jgi:hypothetical protein